MLIDGHMHLEYGPLSEEYVLQFVKAAQEKGIDHIQILDHTHRFIEFKEAYEPLKNYAEQKEWLENPERKFKDHLDDYVSLMERIKSMDLPVRVSYGLEVCYTTESEELLRNVLKNYSFDFLVGAIHSIDGILYDMPFSKKLLWDVYDTDHIYRRYYELVKSCIQSNLFTQLAHPDTIKMFQYYPSYNLTDTYKEIAVLLKERNMKAECNTGCYYRYSHPDMGLSDEFLQILLDHGIEIITASDAHYPKHVGSFIREADERIQNFKKEYHQTKTSV